MSLKINIDWTFAHKKKETRPPMSFKRKLTKRDHAVKSLLVLKGTDLDQGTDIPIPLVDYRRNIYEEDML
jgi:hypothetical protein